MAKRNRYTDEFRASAVLMLQGAGYPDTVGALSRVSTELRVPTRTLRRWWKGEHNPPPDEVVLRKKVDLVEAIDNEIAAIFDEMGKAREDADYRALGTVIGILLDKKLLLAGQPTSHNKVSGTAENGGISVVLGWAEDDGGAFRKT